MARKQTRTLGPMKESVLDFKGTLLFGDSNNSSNLKVIERLPFLKWASKQQTWCHPKGIVGNETEGSVAQHGGPAKWQAGGSLRSNNCPCQVYPGMRRNDRMDSICLVPSFWHYCRSAERNNHPFGSLITKVMPTTSSSANSFHIHLNPGSFQENLYKIAENRGIEI